MSKPLVAAQVEALVCQARLITVANGTLTPEQRRQAERDMVAGVAVIAPVLDDDQRRRLDDVIAALGCKEQ